MQDASALEKQELASKIAQQGAIGQALEQALKDLGTLSSNSKEKSVRPDVERFGEEQSTNSSDTVGRNYTEILQHYVPKQFGKLVANTDWKSNCDHSCMSAHLSHYNRFHGQWRIVATKAILRPKRPSMYRKVPKKKKIRQRILQEEIDSLSKVELDGDLQILAYHDLE